LSPFSALYTKALAIARADAKRQQEGLSGKVTRTIIDIFSVSETIIFNTLCRFIDLEPLYYRKNLADWINSTWLAEEAKNRYQVLARSIFSWQISYKKVNELRGLDASQPFVFLRFLSPNLFKELLFAHLDRILITFENYCFPVFHDARARASMGEYLSLIMVQDFIWNAMFGLSEYTCWLWRERNRMTCAHLAEGNVCDSSWPKKAWGEDHPCSFLKWLKKINKYFYGE